MDRMSVMNIDHKVKTSTTLTLTVARLSEYPMCVALHLVTLEKPAWRNSIVMDFEVILIMNHMTLAIFIRRVK